MTRNAKVFFVQGLIYVQPANIKQETFQKKGDP